MPDPMTNDDFRQILIGEHTGLKHFRDGLRHIPSSPRWTFCKCA